MLCIPSELYFCLFDPLKLKFLVIVSVQSQVIMFDVKRLKTYKNESGEIYMGEIRYLMLWVLLIVLLVRFTHETNELYL